MRLIALRPCSFGGKKYFIGDEVPEEDVINLTVHESQGTLAAIKYDQNIIPEAAENRKVMIPVIRDGEGDVADVLSIPLTEGEIQHVFSIMQMTADKAIAAMEDIGSEDVLIVLHASDSRSAVKKAAKKRAEQLSFSIDPDSSKSMDDDAAGGA